MQAYLIGWIVEFGIIFLHTVNESVAGMVEWFCYTSARIDHTAVNVIASGRTFEGIFPNNLSGTGKNTENLVQSVCPHRAHFEPWNIGPSFSFCSQYENYWSKLFFRKQGMIVHEYKRASYKTSEIYHVRYQSFVGLFGAYSRSLFREKQVSYMLGFLWHLTLLLSTFLIFIGIPAIIILHKL